MLRNRCGVHAEPAPALTHVLNRSARRLVRTGVLRIVILALTVAAATGFVSLWRMTQMPLSPYKGPLPPLTEVQSEVASRLSGHVRYLSATIGERNVHSAGSFEAITDYLEQNLVHAGCTVTEQPYRVEGQVVANLEAQLLGSEKSEAAVVVGSHDDSVGGTVGANENASGVAATLELARLLKGNKLRRTYGLCFFLKMRSHRISRPSQWAAWCMRTNCGATVSRWRR